MWTFLLVSLCIGILGGHGASLQQAQADQGDDQSCKLVISKDAVVANGFVTAWGGSLNQVDCKVVCPPDVPNSPAIQWFKLKPDGLGLRKIKSFKKRVYSVDSYFGSVNTLTFKNFLKRDVGTYKCRAWLGSAQGWTELDVHIRYGCHAPGFLCDFSRCLPASFVCDGKQQCEDGYDEAFCGLCAADEFECDGGCISGSFRCDGYYDCADGKDEDKCSDQETTLKPTTQPPTSTTGTTQSQTQTSTASIATTGDYNDYMDYDFGDEDDPTVRTTQVTTQAVETSTTPVETSTTPVETSTTPLDKTSTTPLDETSTTPVEDFSTTTVDETSTTPVDDATTSVNEIVIEGCYEEEFECPDGKCIPSEWVCDSYTDCVDSFDELHCEEKEDGCLTSEFTCDEGMCVPQAAVCNGTGECPFAEDEDGCGCLNDSEFMCGDGTCVPLEARCDNFPDCMDASDEAGCDFGRQCPESLVLCADQKICYRQDQTCDGYPHCDDGSDELNCPTTQPPTAVPTVAIDEEIVIIEDNTGEDTEEVIVKLVAEEKQPTGDTEASIFDIY